MQFIRRQIHFPEHLVLNAFAKTSMTNLWFLELSFPQLLLTSRSSCSQQNTCTRSCKFWVRNLIKKNPDNDIVKLEKRFITTFFYRAPVKATTEVFYIKRLFLKILRYSAIFSNIDSKTAALESHFNKVAGLKAFSFIKKIL